MGTRTAVGALAALAVLFASTSAHAQLIVVTPSSHDHGMVEVGTNGADQMFTVENDSGETMDLIITGFALSGADCGLFDTSFPATDVTLMPGESTSFTVGFNPTARGAVATCNVVITSNTGGVADTDTNVAQDGTGIGADLTVSVSSLDLGNQRISAGATAAMTFDIDNVGELDLDINDVVLGGTDAADFNMSGWTSGPVTLMPADPVITISVTFDPTTVGAKVANIQVQSTDPVTANETVDLDGVGTSALISVPASIDHGDVVRNATNNETLTITNNGTHVLTINSVMLAGTDAGMYSLGAVPATVAAGGSEDITVSCTPTAVGDHNDATVEIDSDADGASPDPSVSLLCHGVKPDISITPNLNDIDFGDVLVGQGGTPAQKVVVNANLSTTSPLTFDVEITGADAADFDVAPNGCENPSSCVVARNGSRTLTFDFTPSGVGTHSATATITSDDQETPILAFGLTGEGVRPEINLLVPALGSFDFGDVDVNTNSSTTTIRVENAGTSDLSIDAVSLGGSTPGQFSIQSGSIPGPDIVLAPGATSEWTVRCEPTSQGNKSATFRIDSDDAVGNDPILVALTCRGVESVLDVDPPPTIDFGDVRLGESATPEITVTLTNSGNIDLDVNSLSISPSVFFFSATNPPPVGSFQLAANGGNVSFDIGFTPVLNQQYFGVLQIETSSETRMVNIAGYGRQADLTVTPTSYDFGDVDICAGAGTQVFTVENTGDADWRFVSVSQSNNDFAIDQVSETTNTVLNPSDTMTFRVTATPANVGTTTDTIVFQSDIPNGTMTMVDIQATGISNDIQLSSNAVDFGNHDVQELAGITRSVTVTNPGDSPLTITDLDIAGAGASAYTLGVVALPVTIMPNDPGLAVPVTFQPSVESTGEPPASLFITSDAACGTVSEIPLSGRGTDRHIATNPGDLEFGEVYRNPIEPVALTVDIGNTGLADLNISAVSPDVDGSPFRLMTNAPMSIDPESSQTVTVLFSPTAVAEFNEQMIIMNDDSDEMMSIVNLHGFGVSRQVTLSHVLPIDLGTTGVGIPTRVSAAVEPSLQLVSMNPNDAFTVREIRLVDPDSGMPVDEETFELRGISAGDVIDPMGTLEIDVEVSPQVAGRFVAVIEVYLDEDPLVVTFVEISGEAVEVQVRGGGCSASGTGTPGGAALLLLGLVVLGLVGRKRLRAALPIAVALVGVAASAGAAHAQPTTNIELQTFRPPPSVEGGMLSVELPYVGVNGAWAVGLTLNQTMNPITLVSHMRPGETDQPVTSRSMAELGFSYALADRFEVGGLFPIMSQSGDQPMFSGLAPAEGTALGDIAVHAKASLVDSSPLSLGASTTVTLPTASADQFAGVDGVSLHLRGIAGVESGRVMVGANGGLRVRGASELGDISQGNELTYGLAGAYRVLPELSAIGEIYGAFGMGSDETKGVSPLEWLGGARYRVSQQVSVSGGVGWGLISGIGAPDFRGFVHLTYSPKASEIEPFPVEKGEVVVVDRGDDDNDGIINSDDQCPNQAEDIDDWEDSDGCPDPDNDGDGLADDVDPCPRDAEDADGFKDDDGCPDPDNDGDKVADIDDGCPNEPEDIDGFEDNDGCDDPDNDNDGIPDVIDQCALEPEVINGNNDDDGCPDDGESLVMVMADRMEIFEGVKFKGKSATIQKKSHNVLGQIAATMRANRDFLRIRISVHVHPRNRKDEDLSRKRAEAVKQWLIGWGIEPERLDTKGYGSTRPLVEKGQRGAAAINDRVEFIILEKKIE